MILISGVFELFEKYINHLDKEDIDKLKKDLFNFRFQKVNGQVKSPAKINETKKTIARLKTLLEGKNV